jgi:hypothetical protein
LLRMAASHARSNCMISDSLNMLIPAAYQQAL